ncbi:MAG: ATP-binding protein [Moraxellaceae bacterium]
MRLTDEQLERLLDEVESDRAERKESFKGEDKVLQAICAFANNLPNHADPSIIFIGVKDNGTPSHLPITDKLLQDLAHIRSNGRILPPPVLLVEKRHLKGADVAVVTVAAADAPPVRFEGRIWIRTGPRRAIATQQEETILNERRRFKLLPFDLHPVDTAELSDLSRSYFESEYLPSAFAPDILEANGRSYEQRLSSTRMIVSTTQTIPTVLGCLTCGVRPRDFVPASYIQFLRIDGMELSDPILDQEAIDGRLVDMLRRIDEKLQAHIRIATDIQSAETELRRPDYPLAALQQLVRNAVMHRSYEHTHAPIRVSWFNDRIEIHNAGGPFGQVNLDNFGEAGITDYRNPNIAEAMKVLGYVQRFGVGISTARRLLRDNQQPDLEFVVNAQHVLAIVRK